MKIKSDYSLRALLFVLATVVAAAECRGGEPKTFTNPMCLENVPVGLLCRDLPNGSKPRSLALTETSVQYRELADPSLFFENGAMYVFPSGDLCWKSIDRGATWKYVDIGLRGGIGYAPTVEKFRGKYYILAGWSPLYAADSVEGPYKELGHIKLPEGGDVPKLMDPMLFADGDRLYLYWGCTPTNGIWGVELDADNPLLSKGEAKRLVAQTIDECPWEEAPGNPGVSYIEGAWMVKYGGKYHLTYSASGTEHETYAMGDAAGDSPLGEFVKSNVPFFKKTDGLVRGTGHGSIVRGWDGDWYIAYSLCVGAVHGFERLIGFEKADLRLDENGAFRPFKATETPMRADGGKCGWKAIASSDGDIAKYDVLGALPASREYPVEKGTFFRSFRVIWRDIGLDTQRGVKPGAIRYRVWARSGGEWKIVCDASENDRDLFVDYREIDGAPAADRVRLEVLGAPEGITPAIAEFTAFGDRAGPVEN